METSENWSESIYFTLLAPSLAWVEPFNGRCHTFKRIFHNSFLSTKNYSLKQFHKAAGKNASKFIFTKPVYSDIKTNKRTTTKKENYRATFSMDIYTIVFNKILKHQTDHLICTTYCVCVWYACITVKAKLMLTAFSYCAPSYLLFWFCLFVWYVWYRVSLCSPSVCELSM